MGITLKPYPEYKDSGLPWLGKIPQHWSSGSVKRHFSIQLGKMLQGTQAKANERPVYYLKAQHVQWFSIRTAELPTMWASPEEVVQFGVQPGDLLVCEGGEGGRCGIVKQISDQCIIQNALHRIRPAGTSRAQYLQYVMSAIAATGWFAAINNKATIAHFTREKFGALGIPVPPSHEQDAIVAFLTHADHRINHLIRTKQQLIALLNEQKQTIIHRAVTRGLDPNVRLKPSGVDWLGDVPEHWEVMALRMRYSVQLGKMLDTKRITGSHLVPYLRNTDVQWDCINSTNFPMMDIPEREHDRYLVKLGDLLVCEGGEVGRAAFWDGALPMCGYQKALHRLRPTSNGRECPRFLFYVLFAASKRGIFIADGSENTIAHLTAEKLRRHRFAFPPKTEQEAIALHLDTTLSDLEQAIERANHTVDLLREYRTRLITDVVTGKLDVRGVELPALDEAETLEDWETDEDTEADVMDEMEGVDA